jgi:hypothetical protein
VGVGECLFFSLFHSSWFAYQPSRNLYQQMVLLENEQGLMKKQLFK